MDASHNKRRGGRQVGINVENEVQRSLRKIDHFENFWTGIIFAFQISQEVFHQLFILLGLQGTT